MKVTSVANFKGGTAKTTTACSMAAILAERGFRVLLIDADPQHNSSDFFGADEDCQTLSDVLAGTAEPYWPDVLTPTGREGLSLLPADMQLLTLDLASMQNGSGAAAVHRLQEFVDVLRGDDAFDFVLIDCPPSFTAASVAALCASDEVIIPTRVDRFSQAGVGELTEQIRHLQHAEARSFVWRILVVMADGTNLYRQGNNFLRAAFPGWAVFETAIRATVKVSEATFARQPITEYAPRCTAAQDYRALVDEWLEEGK